MAHPPIRMTKASSARAAATQHKVQPKQQPAAAVAAYAASMAQAAALAFGAAGSQLASPEKTARPDYALRNTTPDARRVAAFSQGEAGVDPYSVRPGERVGQVAGGAGDDSTPLSNKKYEAEREEYLQVRRCKR